MTSSQTITTTTTTTTTTADPSSMISDINPKTSSTTESSKMEIDLKDSAATKDTHKGTIDGPAAAILNDSFGALPSFNRVRSKTSDSQSNRGGGQQVDRESLDHHRSTMNNSSNSRNNDGRSSDRRSTTDDNNNRSSRNRNDSSSRQDSRRNDRNDRQRNNNNTNSRDSRDRSRSRGNQQKDSEDRSGGGGRGREGRDGGRDGGGRDGARDGRDSNRGRRDDRQQPQSARSSHSKDRPSQPTKDSNSSSNHQSKDHQQSSNNNNRDKNRDNEQRQRKEVANTNPSANPQPPQQQHQKEKEQSSSTAAKPDPFNLLSITGKTGHLNPKKPFFGSSRIVDEFERINKIGEGTYGVVYRAKDKRTNEIVALKRIRMERESDGLPISSLREIKLLKTLKHENIVLVKEVAVGSDLDQIFLVMEYCQQDMAALMDNIKKPYSASEVKCLMHQLLKGIEYCHDHYVVHRDLKLSNLLLTEKGVLKIADFGLARSFGLPSRPMTPKVVTLWYRAPELLFGDLNYTTAVDMWSAGCIFGELLKHAPLLPGKVEKEQVDLMIELLGTPHEKIWAGFNQLPMSSIKLPEQRFNNLKKQFPNITDATRSLLSGLLTYDPKKRLSVKQALAHPYFIEAPPAKLPSMLPTHPEIRNNVPIKR
ncbi:Cyclin-dependent kinase 10 [Gryganskiella cystojenkinii]|nr:Cyclin-dependent kinase 10 [Gryganskiella cystojenkinii]